MKHEFVCDPVKISLAVEKMLNIKDVSSRNIKGNVKSLILHLGLEEVLKITSTDERGVLKPTYFIRIKSLTDDGKLFLESVRKLQVVVTR